MATTPQPPLTGSMPIPLKRFAALSGVSHVTIRRLCADGIMPRNADGTIPPEEGYRALLAYLAKTSPKRAARLAGETAPPFFTAPPAVRSPAAKSLAPPSPPPPPQPQPPPTPSVSPPPQPQPPPTPSVSPRLAALREGGDIQTKLLTARLAAQQIRAQRDKLRVERELGEVVPVADVCKRHAKVCARVTEILHGLPSQLLSLYEGPDRAAFLRAAADLIDDAIAEIHRTDWSSQ